MGPARCTGDGNRDLPAGPGAIGPADHLLASDKPAPHLPTTTTVTADGGGATSAEQRTIKTEYDWDLRKPTKTTVDPNGLNLVTSTIYDPPTGNVVETRMPRSPSGGDASAT